MVAANLGIGDVAPHRWRVISYFMAAKYECPLHQLHRATPINSSFACNLDVAARRLGVRSSSPQAAGGHQISASRMARGVINAIWQHIEIAVIAAVKMALRQRGIGGDVTPCLENA